VVGDAAHGHGDAFLFVPRGKSDLKFTRGEDRVVKKEFVEISQTKKEEGAGMLFLDGGILPHQRGGRLSHFKGLRARIITNDALLSR
jgi:hypothetical protein